MKQVMRHDGTEPEVTLPGTAYYHMRAEQTKREYEIRVWVPESAPPASGYPVIYLLDANAVFGTMVEAMRIQSLRPEKTGVVPAVIVGVGYTAREPFPPDRHYDFMMPVPEGELPRRPDGATWPEHGGAEAFTLFIEEQLKPDIERRYAIDRSRQSVVGHSLGGLFVLQLLLERPGTYRNYIAGSPSLHWNSAWIAWQQETFASRMQDNSSEIHVLLGAGELEGSHPSGVIERSRAFTQWLNHADASGVRADFICFEDEGHISVLPVLISRALRFASRD
ncbi:alpha/beta hydrolase-fold protein [Paenibacillus taichungensis]|nr:alpha/beta hydrolase-fold protein [Paenibacillus taichungensis]